MKKFAVVLIVLVVIGGGAALTQLKPASISFVVPVTPTPTPDLRDKNFERELETKVKEAKGTYGVYVYRLASKESYGINTKDEFEAASIFKLPALVAAEQQIDNGQWKIDSEFTIQKSDIASGSGPLQFLTSGTKVSLHKMLTVLGKNSDNTAWRMLNRLIGMEALQRQVNDLGMTDSNYKNLTTTPVDMGRIWKYIYEKKIGWDYLSDSIYEDRIPVGLPKNTPLIHKVGTDVGVWSDSGVVNNSFILVIMTGKADADESKKLVPELTKMIWEYESTREI